MFYGMLLAALGNGGQVLNAFHQPVKLLDCEKDAGLFPGLIGHVLEF